MSFFKITFTPAEPYFFGNEKSFKYPGQKNGGAYSNSYYIKSESIPSQSTVLGALRYLLIPVKDFPDSAEEVALNERVVGSSSFSFDSAEKQSFGAIESISPVVITNGDRIIIPMPLDHNTASESMEYTPLADYREISTSDGKKLFAADYDVKKGPSGDFVCINAPGSNLVKADDIFVDSERVGIRRDSGSTGKNEDGFFKKCYKMLKKGYGFTVYAKINEEVAVDAGGFKAELDGKTDIVCLGQGKSPFSVKFERSDFDLEKAVSDFLGGYSRSYGFVYCLGDSFSVGKTESDFYDDSLFAIVKTKDYRSFVTAGKGCYQKGSTLHRLIKAGSVIFSDDPEKWISGFTSENASQIGYNKFIVISKK